MFKKDKKGKIFESLGKNVKNLKIFWKSPDARIGPEHVLWKPEHF